jgi:hypothetical protein
MRTTIPSAVSGFFVDRALPFRVDSGTLVLPGYRVVGARVHAIGGRVSALGVHRDARNKIVVCQRFEGRVHELPRADRTVLRDPAELYLYRSRRARAVFWQEEGLIRSLASDVPEEELVGLAMSSAAP